MTKIAEAWERLCDAMDDYASAYATFATAVAIEGRDAQAAARALALAVLDEAEREASEHSGYDKLTALRLAALGGSLGQEYSAEDRADAEDVLMASAPILAEVIGELREALEDAPCFHWGQMHQLTTQHGRKRCSEDIAWADGSRHPCKEPCQRCQALTNTDKKLQEALND